MKTARVLLAVALASLATLGACKSKEAKTPEYDSTTVECICGTPEAAWNGCPHPLCLRGEGNPENPECVCGTLSIEPQKEN